MIFLSLYTRKYYRLISSSCHWSPSSKVHLNLGVIIKDLLAIFLDFGRPFFVKLKSFEVFFNLRNLGESEDAGTSVITCYCPCNGKLCYRESEFFGESIESSQALKSGFFLIWCEILVPREGAKFLIGVTPRA